MLLKLVFSFSNRFIEEGERYEIFHIQLAKVSKAFLWATISFFEIPFRLQTKALENFFVKTFYFSTDAGEIQKYQTHSILALPVFRE